MNYYNYPTNVNTSLEHGMVPPEVQYKNMNQSAEANNRLKRFRPPVQHPPVSDMHMGNVSSNMVRNEPPVFNRTVSNIMNRSSTPVAKMPLELMRVPSVAGPSRNHQITCVNPRLPVQNNRGNTTPMRNYEKVSMNTSRITDNISIGVADITVQDNPVVAPKHFPMLAGSSRTDNKEQSTNNESGTASNFNVKVFGSTDTERIFIFTGNVEKVIKWNKIFQNHFCYYEVIASVISIHEGSINTQRIMLLRDRIGPILQVIYYTTTHMDIQDFHVGQILRCVGKMSASNILNAISIRSATQEEIDTLQRLSLVCDHAVSHFLKV